MTIILNTPATGPAPVGAAALAALPTLSLGPSATPVGIPVPDVTGLDAQSALDTLQGFGFVATVVQVPGPGRDGRVYGQQPRPDDIVAHGSPVRIFVIATPPGDEGMRFDDIDAAIGQIGTAIDAEAVRATTRHSEVIDKLDALADTLALLETEADAADRHAKLLEALSSGSTTPVSKAGTARAKPS
jgi:hypothetical protein